MEFEHRSGKLIQQNQSIARLPSGTAIEIPVFSYHAKKDGPTLLLMAGMHGDEINGVEIMRRIIRQKLYKVTAGRVICIPILNVFGFINLSREVPDGKDVNRSFPGNKKGSLASQFAHFMVTEILPNIDYGVDFHTGGKQLNNYPQIRTAIDDPINFSLAAAFAAPFTIRASYRDKSLRKEAAKMGKPILVYEGGESLRLQKPAIEVGIDGVLRLMKHLEMIDEAPEPAQENIIIQKSSWSRARMAGLFHSKTHIGSHVTKSEVVGALSDPYGASEKNIRATEECHIIAINRNPVVNRGDALFHFGMA